jgi:hypothetical protein
MAMRRNGGWWESIQNFIEKFNGPNAPPRPTPVLHRPNAPQEAPQKMPEGDAMGVILQSARQGTLVLMLYNGNWRYIEPYSYRSRKNGTTDLMAFCHRHQHIEAFKPGKIESAQMTEMSFKPRWPIEIGRE